MAIGNVGGFSEGFTRGFGLVNQQQQQRADNQFRQDQLAATQEFRTQQQADQAEQNRLTAQYRGEMLSGQQAEKEAADKFRADSLGLKREELEWLRDPTNPQYQMTLANAREKNAAAGSKRIENELGDRYNQRVMAAQNLNLAAAIALKTDKTDADRETFRELLAANEGTAFDFGKLTDYVSGEVPNDVNRYLGNVAAGGDLTMAPEVARSFSIGMGLEDHRAIGMVVDDRFVNAPEHLKDGNYRVARMGLYQPKLNLASDSKEATISGTMAVIVENTVTGEEEPYFAPLTENRRTRSNPDGSEVELQGPPAPNTIGGVPLELVVPEVAQVTAATSQVLTKISPLIRNMTRESKILTRFGDISKKDSGVEAFSSTVNNELDRIIRGLQGGGTPSGLQLLVNPEEAKALRGEQLTPGQTAMLRQRIEDNLLHGTTATAPNHFVGRWLEETKTGLKDVALPNAPKGSVYSRDDSFVMEERDRSRSEARTLGDLVNIDELPEKTISRLNGLFDSEGNLRNPALYVRTMYELGFLTKR